MNEDRLVKIETKIAFQEQAISDLNDVILEQQNKIKKLAAICDALVKQGRDFSERIPGIESPANEKPPHY